MKIQPQNVPDEYMGRPLPIYAMDVDRAVLEVPERKVPQPQKDGEDQDEAVARWKDQTVWSKHLVVAPVFPTKEDFIAFKDKCCETKGIAPEDKMWIEVPCEVEQVLSITTWVERQIKTVSMPDVVELASKEECKKGLLMRTNNMIGGDGYYNEVVLTYMENVIQVHRGPDEPWQFQDNRAGILAQLCWQKPTTEKMVLDGKVLTLQENSDMELGGGGRRYLFRSLIVPGWIDERCHILGPDDLPRGGLDGWRELRTQYVRRLMEKRERGN